MFKCINEVHYFPYLFLLMLKLNCEIQLFLCCAYTFLHIIEN